MNNIRVLVTGAGSGVGQGIVKSLRKSDLPVTLVIADISPMNAALYRGDEAILIPKVEEDGALDAMIKVIKDNNIHVVMIGSEFEIEFFSSNKDFIEKNTNALIMISDPKTIQLSNDKYLTAEFLKENKLPHAESFISNDLKEFQKKASEWRYPVYLKPRVGTSSRGVYFIQSEDELNKFYPMVSNPMLQCSLGSPNSELNTEYTCSVFKCSDGSLLGPFTARRTIRAGHSWVIEVKPFEELYDVLLKLGKVLNFSGSLNVQLMLTDGAPVIFELNCRFSGTTAVRAHFGFNEPEMFLKNYYLKQKLENPKIRSGMSFRYSEEVFLENVDSKDLVLPLPQGEVNQWF